MTYDQRKIRRMTTQYPDFALVDMGGELVRLGSYDDCLDFARSHQILPSNAKLEFRSDTAILLATIPSRRGFAQKLLECLRHQTVRCEVLLLGDGYADPKALPNPNGPTTSRIEPEPQGAGNRWRWLEHLVISKIISPDTKIICIDDDMIPTPFFIESCVRVMDEHPEAAFAWAGRTPNTAGWHPLNAPVAGNLRILCTYAAMIRAKHVVGIGDYPESDLLLGLQGDDELLLSAHLVKQQVHLIRPAGHAQVFCGPTQDDKVAQHNNPRTDVVQKIRKVLYEDITRIGTTSMAEEFVNPRDRRRRKDYSTTTYPSVAKRGKRPYLFELREFWDGVILRDGWDSEEYTALITKDILKDAPLVIFDVGANFGSFTGFCRDKWPNSRVVAFEPTPETSERFRKQILPDDLVDFRQQAVYGENKPQNMIIAPGVNHGANRVGFGGKQEIDTVSIHDLLKEFPRVDILKLDCELAEEDIIMSMSEKELLQCQCITGEYHSVDIMKRMKPHLDKTHTGEWYAAYGHQGIFRLRRR